MISGGFGLNSAISFLPGTMIHVDLERSQSLSGRRPFVPIGAHVGERTSSFERGENQMDGSSIRDCLRYARLGRELLDIGDSGVQNLLALVGIPFRAQAAAIVF